MITLYHSIHHHSHSIASLYDERSISSCCLTTASTNFTWGLESSNHSSREFPCTPHSLASSTLLCRSWAQNETQYAVHNVSHTCGRDAGFSLRTEKTKSRNKASRYLEALLLHKDPRYCLLESNEFHDILSS